VHKCYCNVVLESFKEYQIRLSIKLTNLKAKEEINYLFGLQRLKLHKRVSAIAPSVGRLGSLAGLTGHGK
jgi:hypothetical protein